MGCESHLSHYRRECVTCWWIFTTAFYQIYLWSNKFYENFMNKKKSFAFLEKICQLLFRFGVACEKNLCLKEQL